MNNMIGNWLWAWSGGVIPKALAVVVAGSVASSHYLLVGDAAVAFLIVTVVALTHVINYTGGMRYSIEELADREEAISNMVSGMLANQIKMTLVNEQLRAALDEHDKELADQIMSQMEE